MPETTSTRKPRRKAKPAEPRMRGRLKPHDPFELIRWLALSQPDPRKALAELVQNSLDAGASRIRITRKRERGAPCLHVYDNGEGVVPELERAAALRHIATHIGHSRKRSLSPQERLALMTQGQYGIGLLGFWSLGNTLEMRSSVPGQKAHRLILHRDQPDYQIEPLRGRLAMDERSTEVVIVGLHPEARPALLGRRVADYLAAELRGQLLARPVDLVVEDRMSRGRAQRVIQVRPPKFLGERLDGLGPVPVPGHPPIRLEIYLTGDSGRETAGVALYSAGTMVAESFTELGALGLDHAPWTDPRLSGIVDFPAFRVSPGSRRGVNLDEAAGAFAQALSRLEPILSGVLDAIDRRRAEELDKSMIRDLQRAFRDFHRQRPRFAMLPVQAESEPQTGSGDDAGDGALAAGPGTPSPAEPDGEPESEPETGITDLLPPGPLAEVRLTPKQLRVEHGGRARIRARAVDATGRSVLTQIEYSWRLSEPAGTLQFESERRNVVDFIAGDRSASFALEVTAREDSLEAAAEVPIKIVEELRSSRGDEGIPEPELVNVPGVSWRSQMQHGRWQVNTGHRDFRNVADRPALKLRYLAMLFAKEVVCRSHQDPRFQQPLEQLVEIATYADSRLTKTPPRRSPAKPRRTKRTPSS